MTPTRKYRNIPTQLDNVKFDSLKEAHRYEELRLLLYAHKITQLEIHPAYPITVKDKPIAVYYADFLYYDVEKQQDVIEDVKSPVTKTQVYRLKKKLVEALYGIEITEV